MMDYFYHVVIHFCVLLVVGLSSTYVPMMTTTGGYWHTGTMGPATRFHDALTECGVASRPGAKKRIRPLPRIDGGGG